MSDITLDWIIDWLVNIVLDKILDTILDIHLDDQFISNNEFKKHLKNTMILLMPLIPHISYECWEKLEENKNISNISWPKFDEHLLVDKDCTIVIQVNGRKRGTITVPLNLKESEITKKAKVANNVKKNIENKKIIRKIYIKNKLINFII